MLFSLNVFQWLVAPITALLLARSLLQALRGLHRRSAVAGACVWLAAIVTVLKPELTMRIAKCMGIGRGADLILYIFVIAFLAALFYFYNRTLQLEASISKLVRQMAIREAGQPPASQPSKAAAPEHPSLIARE